MNKKTIFTVLIGIGVLYLIYELFLKEKYNKKITGQIKTDEGGELSDLGLPYTGDLESMMRDENLAPPPAMSPEEIQEAMYQSEYRATLTSTRPPTEEELTIAQDIKEFYETAQDGIIGLVGTPKSTVSTYALSVRDIIYQKKANNSNEMEIDPLTGKAYYPYPSEI